MGTVLLVLVRAVLLAQATVAGAVRDAESDHPLVGAVVELTDLNRAATTDDEGQYRFVGIPAGPHQVSVHLIGYAPRLLNALVPLDGLLEINFSLHADPVRLPTLEVRAPVIAGDSDRFAQGSFPDRTLSAAEVQNHPLLAEADVFEAFDGGEVALQPESPNGMHIRGGASDQTGYLLDGIPVLSPYHTAGVFSALNPDAISRLSLTSGAPSPAYPEALSGTVLADTRSPGTSLHSQGSVSSSQLRMTLDGPLGLRGAGYLVSLRSGVPDLIAPKHEPSYLRGRSGDWLVKLEAPAFGGQVRLLGYESHDQFNTAVVADGASETIPASQRNQFAWHSSSLGVQWQRLISNVRLKILGWSAASGASAVWGAPVARLDMISVRRDEGVTLSAERRGDHSTTLAGVRVERSRTGYRIEADSALGPSWSLSARTPVIAAFVQHTRPLVRAVQLTLASSLASAAGNLRFSPRAQLQWELSPRLRFVGDYSRLHQFAQSLRNGESVAGNVFPVDLYIGAGARGVPVARSDQGVIALEYRPSTRVRIGVQGFVRAFDGLLLVAPEVGEPFSTGSFAAGTGTARGASVDLSVTGPHFGLMGSYGLQQVRIKYGHSSFVPEYGATHRFQGGIIVLPTATSSVRLGVTGALGRRSTALSGGFEWEACNLVDQGCEFGGSPSYDGQALGGTRLPAYLRVDLGVRKSWQLGLGRRDGLLTLFGTLSNLFNRKNVLTYARNLATGQPVAIEMRPRAPLVVGMEWRF